MDPCIRDAPLTLHGTVQAQTLGRKIARRNLVNGLDIEICITSPLCRAVQTSLHILRDISNPCEVMRQVPIIACPLHREIALTSADVGQSPEKLASEFPEVDFSKLSRTWWRSPSLEGRADMPRHYFGESQAEVQNRATQFCEWLQKRPEKSMLVVGHGLFLKQLLDLPKLPNCGAVERVLRKSTGGVLELEPGRNVW